MLACSFLPCNLHGNWAPFSLLRSYADLSSGCGECGACFHRDVIKGTMRLYRVHTRPSQGIEMVDRCGCSNTHSDCVSLFKFPRDGTLRQRWERQVQRTQAQWKATDQSFLCSDHFTEDSFEVDSALAAQFGMKKRRRLKPNTIPTIFPRPSMSDAHASGGESSSSRRKGQLVVVEVVLQLRKGGEEL